MTTPQTEDPSSSQAPSSEPATPPARRGMAGWPAVAPMRHASFRYLWVGTVLTQVVRWMDQVAQGWLMYQLTGSPLWVGLVGTARGVPMLLFSLPGGVLVDRFDKRLLLLGGQWILLLLAFSQAVLVFLGLIQPWHLLVASGAGGAVMALIFPARQSIIPSTVDRPVLGNAVAITTAGQNSTRVIGPSLAGIIIGAIGVAGSFALETLITLAALWSTSRLTLSAAVKRARTTSAWQDIMEGVRYVAASPQLRPQMLLAAVPTMLVIPYQQMMPVFAADVLHVGPEGLGLLLAVNGGGAVVGAVLIASLRPGRRGPVLLASAAGMGVLVALFALSTNWWLSLFLSTLAGTAQSLYLATNNTLIHLHAPDRLRGRILSVYMATWSLMPLGVLPMSAMAEAIGVSLAVALFSVVSTLLIGVIAWVTPSLREV